MRWCTGPCLRLLSVVAFDGAKDVCIRCHDLKFRGRQRALRAFRRHLELPPLARVAHPHGRCGIALSAASLRVRGAA